MKHGWIGGGVPEGRIVPGGRPDGCTQFFTEFFARTDAGRSWAGSYARAQWVHERAEEQVNAVSVSVTEFGAAPGAPFASGDVYYTWPNGDRAGDRVIIRRSGSVSANDTFVGGGQDLIDLRCKAVGRKGWLVQGYYVDPVDPQRTVRKYQWATSFAFVRGPGIAPWVNLSAEVRWQRQAAKIVP